MRAFREVMRRARWVVAFLIVTNVNVAVEGWLLAETYSRHVESEKRLQEMATRLRLPVEALRADNASLLETLGALFANPKTKLEAAAVKSQMARVEVQLKSAAAELAANPFLPNIAAVKQSAQAARLEGILWDLTQLTELRAASLSPHAKRALLQNLKTSIEGDLALPDRNTLPSKARARRNQLQGKLQSLFARLRPVLDEQGALSDENVARTVARLAVALDREVTRPSKKPRFVNRPLPIELRDEPAVVEALDLGHALHLAAPSSAIASAPAVTSAAAKRPGSVTAKDAPPVAPEIAALATSLGNSPARIFAWVHDHIRFDPKWGAVRSPVGVLYESEGTAWDQALLLRELLSAASVDAVVEWGQIEISTDLLTNLTGVDDPLRATSMLATGGIPIVALTQGGLVVGARLSHVWVKANVRYIPDRGALPGTPDTWIRMDPSFKRTQYAAGLRVHDQVPFGLGPYLQSGTELSPRRYYEEALWSYIRANSIPCTNLGQLGKTGTLIAEQFPILPGTLRGKIVRVDGEAATTPATVQPKVTVEVRSAQGATLATWNAPVVSTYGERIEVRYVGATPDDEAVIAQYGGIFQTPPYLIELAPTIRLGTAILATGSAIGSAEETEIWITLTEPGGTTRTQVHSGLAGEQHLVSVDFGALPQQIVERHQAVRSAAIAAGDAATAETETLYLLGAEYLSRLARDFDTLSGWKWQRVQRLGTAGVVSQMGDVTTTVQGVPLSFRRAERNLDLGSLTVGIFPADGDTAFRRETFELLGAQSSSLEGEIFNLVIEEEGIAAVQALTRSRRAAQPLTLVDSANVTAVLAAVDLGVDAEEEIRLAVQGGRVAWVADEQITVHRWTGTGYILEEPATGAAAYVISGGYAGGSDTGGVIAAIQEFLGSEPWIASSPLGAFLQQMLALLGGGGDGGGGGGDGPGSNQGDPINMATGNLWFSETDLTIMARGLPVSWGRTYNSRSNYLGPMGYGWTFGYGERLDAQPDGSVVYREGDGTEHLFAPDGDGGFLSPAGKHLTLTQDASGSFLRTKEGLASAFATDGRLLSFSEPNGNTLQLTYDGSGNLASVSDAIGRQVLTVTTADGKISRLTDLTGRFVEYGYTGDDLTLVKDTAGKEWIYAYDEGHNIILKQDPLGHADRYAHDAMDRCFRHTNPLGYNETFSYDSQGARAVLTDRRGNDSYFEFDATGRALLQADPLGNASRSTWDADNNRRSTTDPRGGSWTRTFDDRGNQLSETNPKNETNSATYDPVLNRVLTTTDAKLHVVTSTYDPAGNGNLLERREIVNGETLVETLRYDATGQLEEQTDARGNTTAYTWHPTKGSIETQSNALDEVTTFGTDALGRIESITDPEMHVTTVVMDAKDRISSFRDPFGNTTSFVYDFAGRRTETVTPRGTTSSLYDDAGQVIKVTDPLQNVTRTEYDAAGNVTARIDARGGRTTSVYDTIGRPIATIDPLGRAWTSGYCGEIGGSCSSCGGGGGSFCDLTDPLGNVTRQEFDELGRVRLMTDPLGNEVTLTFDELGRKITQENALGRTTSFEYDERGRLAAVVEANSARTEYGYDGAGNMTSTKDAEGRVWPRTYDPLNRLKTESDPLGNTSENFYDSLGNLVRRRKADTTEIVYEYDVRRLKTVRLPGGAVESFGYDPLGRRTSMSNSEVSLIYVHDDLNRIVSMTNATLGQTIAYTYDSSGNRKTMTGPKGVVSYFYDAVNRLVEQRDPALGTFRLAYDEVGRRTALDYPNGLHAEYSYDKASRLTSILSRNGQGSVIDGYSYIYDKAGNRTSMNALHEAVSHNYEYDEVDRLTDWERGTDRFERYSYDLVGNRKTLTDQLGLVNYAYNTANMLQGEVRQNGPDVVATAYQWDPNGNLLSKTVGAASPTTYAWNPLDHLEGVTNSGAISSYGYDPLGTRVRETTNGGTRRLLQDMEDIVGVYDEGGAALTYYAHGPGIDEPLGQWASDGSNGYLHRDGLGSITALSNTAGQVSGATRYAAFGSVEASTGLRNGGRYSFTGRELDTTGLMYYRSRYYDANAGRFLQQDSYRGTKVVPPSLHRYTYVLNNPVNYTDPTGFAPPSFMSLTANIVFFTLLAAASATYIWFTCIINPAVGFGRYSCVVRLSSVFYAIPGFREFNALMGILGTVADIVMNVADGTLGWVDFTVLMFLVVMSAAFVYTLTGILIGLKWSQYEIGAATLNAWVMLNWVTRKFKESMIQPYEPRLP